MKKWIAAISIALGLITTFESIDAEAGNARINRRQTKQRAQIRNGVKNKELNKGEAKSLREGQKHVRKMKRRAAKDGKVTNEEKHRINRAQNRQSKRIRKAKNN